MTATVELRLPLGYVEMDAEEMEYLDGGGTVRVKLSVDTVRAIITTAGSVATSLLVYHFTKSKVLAVVAGALARQVIDYVVHNVWTPKAIDRSFSAWFLPNYTISR